MAEILSVATYILKKTGPIPTMKLQKLVYYCQVYYLVKNQEPLFYNEIQAWANGPVIVDLYEKHQGKYMVSTYDFPSTDSRLNEKECACIDFVVKKFGEMTGNQLSLLTHQEAPWLDQRKGLKASERSSNVITLEAIKKYYSSALCENPLFA